jgi:hypothetical protein
MLPLFHSGWNSAPWPPSSCARLPHPSLGFRYRSKLCGQLGRAGLFAAFAASRPVALTLRTHPLMQASRHCFRSLPSVSPDGVLGMHATPSPTGGEVPPGRHLPAPGCLSPHRARQVALGLSPECRPLSPGRFRFPWPDFHLAVLRAGIGPMTLLAASPSRLLRSASYPCRLRAAVHPDRLHPASGTPTIGALPGNLCHLAMSD